MYIVDRVENDTVVIECDDNIFIKMKVCDIDNVAEGDILSKQGDKFFVDVEATKKRREYILNLRKKVLGE